MVIDIIDLSDPQYADLNPVQLSMVRAAQAQKDKLLADLEAEIAKRFLYTVARNTARSSAVKREEARLRAAADAAVDFVRENLLYELAYEAFQNEGNENGRYSYPANPNYNLSYSQRFLVVRQFYMQLTSDPVARLEAYRMDTLARTYLGDFYQTLYDMLASECKQ